MCYGEYKETNIRCSHCPDRGKCNIETELIKREKEYEKEKDKQD